MSKSVGISIANTRDSVYKEWLANGKLLIMLPALGAAWGCNGEGFKGSMVPPKSCSSISYNTNIL